MAVKLAWSDQGNARAVTFDAAPGETHLWTATVTEHPVERGSPIADNVRAQPFRISLDVCISNTPIGLPSSDDDSFTDGVKQTTGAVSLGSGQGAATVFQWSSQFDRVRKVYDALTTLVVDPPSDGITVITSLALYDSMEIVNISVPRNPQIGSKAIRFTVDMQQIQIVDSQTVATPAPKLAQQHKGHKPTKEETDKDKSSFIDNVFFGGK